MTLPRGPDGPRSGRGLVGAQSGSALPEPPRL